jgi:hypothetical protein
METLAGFAVPAQNFPLGDHTYVESSIGHKWGCFGRSNGGTAPICSGQGSAQDADCLSQTNSEAGISYGFTGVCHQASNRILYPGGVLVLQARGYGASERLFTAYGLGPWPQLQSCLGPGTLVSSTGGSTVTRKFSDQIQRICQLFVGQNDSSDNDVSRLKLAELEARFDTFLGHEYDEEKKRLSLAIQAELNEKQEALTRYYDTREINSHQYVSEINELIHRTMLSFQEVLGPDDYEKLFQEDIEASENLVDMETFSLVHKS